MWCWDDMFGVSYVEFWVFVKMNLGIIIVKKKKNRLSWFGLFFFYYWKKGLDGFVMCDGWWVYVCLIDNKVVKEVKRSELSYDCIIGGIGWIGMVDCWCCWEE